MNAKDCRICGESAGQLRCGRCGRCYRWWQEHGYGAERPVDLLHGIPYPCRACSKMTVKNGRRHGLCNACRQWCWRHKVSPDTPFIPRSYIRAASHPAREEQAG